MMRLLTMMLAIKLADNDANVGTITV